MESARFPSTTRESTFIEKEQIFEHQGRWNTFKTFDDILNHLQADVICFQGMVRSAFRLVTTSQFRLTEVKSSRQDLPKQVAIPASYDSFFSFPAKKTGYSGVSTYCRKNVVVPLKAEEGLTGLIHTRALPSDGERISHPSAYPPSTAHLSGESDFKELDNEGRAILVDLRLFVLINVYCPNNGTGSEDREKFKMDYHRLLETRVRGLIQEGREVMVVGDLNACAAVEDHCEGQLMVARGLVEGLQGEEGFWGKDHRRWIRDLLMKEDGTCGGMIDIVRKFWPNRKGMYTCAFSTSLILLMLKVLQVGILKFPLERRITARGSISSSSRQGLSLGYKQPTSNPI
jgi:AP endonuclease-2